MLLRILVAVIVGIIVTAVLDYYGVLQGNVNFLIGLLVGVAAYVSDVAHKL